MDKHARRLTARGIGKIVGATAVEVNCLLKDQGFLYGEPGAYGLTSKGQEFGGQRLHDNGYGGSAYRSWETTDFGPEITDVLDASPEKLAKVREDISRRKQERSAANKLLQAEAEARFHAFQASKEVRQDEPEVDPQKVWIVIAGIAILVAAGYGAYKGVRRYRQTKATQTNTKTDK